MKTGIFLLLMIIGLFCAAGTARIDPISGNAGLRVVSTAAGVSGKNMNWLPPEKAKRMLYFQQRNSCDEWSTMKFSFAADRDTTVRITLRGPYLVTPQKKRLPAAVFYDELRIDGKPAPNGGGLMPWGWHCWLLVSAACRLCSTAVKSWTGFHHRKLSSLPWWRWWLSAS